ncbi:Methylmalonic aciduria and homocystinuria type C protein-like protein, partial [Nibea albiflora]
FSSSDGNHANPSPAPKSAPEASSVDSVPVSSLNPISQAVTTPPTNGSDTTPSSNVTSSFVNNTSTEQQEAISMTPEPKEANGTNISPSPAADNVTDHSTTQPPIPASGSHAPTSHIPVTTVAINATHPAHTAPVDTTQSTTLSTNTSSHVESTLPHPTNQTTLPKTHSSTSAPTPEPASTTTTTITQPDSTSSGGSSHEPLNSVSPTLAQTPPKTSHTETASTTSTTTPLQKVHNNPSPLNVEGSDTTMVHESPKLDPLLAGLVSAFIITAVIITLLLFLKLRRRDNRPEFRRLQDLPMVGWYNSLLPASFHLAYPDDTLAVVVLSTPSMFEQAFLPFMEEKGYQGLSDPIDQCVKHCVSSALSQKMFGVCVHPKFGGWFAIRALLVFGGVLVGSEMAQPVPPDCVPSREGRIQLLEAFNFHWQDWSYRNIVHPVQTYSQKQRDYFSTLPAERFALLKSWGFLPKENDQPESTLDTQSQSFPRPFGATGKEVEGSFNLEKSDSALVVFRVCCKPCPLRFSQIMAAAGVLMTSTTDTISSYYYDY